MCFTERFCSVILSSPLQMYDQLYGLIEPVERNGSLSNGGSTVRMISESDFPRGLGRCFIFHSIGAYVQAVSRLHLKVYSLPWQQLFSPECSCSDDTLEITPLCVPIGNIDVVDSYVLPGESRMGTACPFVACHYEHSCSCKESPNSAVLADHI